MSGTPETNKPTIFTAKVISLGRVTIPEELRNVHEIQEGYIVTFQILSIQKFSPEQLRLQRSLRGSSNDSKGASP